MKSAWGLRSQRDSCSSLNPSNATGLEKMQGLLNRPLHLQSMFKWAAIVVSARPSKSLVLMGQMPRGQLSRLCQSRNRPRAIRWLAVTRKHASKRYVLAWCSNPGCLGTFTSWAGLALLRRPAWSETYRRLHEPPSDFVHAQHGISFPLEGTCRGRFIAGRAALYRVDPRYMTRMFLKWHRRSSLDRPLVV